MCLVSAQESMLIWVLGNNWGDPKVMIGNIISDRREQRGEREGEAAAWRRLQFGLCRSPLLGFQSQFQGDYSWQT